MTAIAEAPHTLTEADCYLGQLECLSMIEKFAREARENLIQSQMMAEDAERLSSIVTASPDVAGLILAGGGAVGHKQEKIALARDMAKQPSKEQLTRVAESIQAAAFVHMRNMLRFAERISGLRPGVPANGEETAPVATA